MKRSAKRYALYSKFYDAIGERETPFNPNPEQQAVLDHCMAQPGFSGFDKFTLEWDIGIADIPTMLDRQDEWFLYGISEDIVVKVPDESLRKSLTLAKQVFLASGAGAETEPDPTGGTIWQKIGLDLNYKQIVDTMEGRHAWL
jgi:hypothetical protein